MQIKIDIKSCSKKKEPIDKSVSFPVTNSQKVAIEKIRKSGKDIDVNHTIRQCIDQIIIQCEKLVKEAV